MSYHDCYIHEKAKIRPKFIYIITIEFEDNNLSIVKRAFKKLENAEQYVEKKKNKQYTLNNHPIENIFITKIKIS